MTTLTAEGLTISREGRTLISELSFRVDAGSSLAVVGPSGSGKTTLLAVVGGLARASSGTVSLDGEPVTGATQRRVAVVLQGYGLVSLLTAAENIEAALRAAGRTTAQARDTTQAALLDLGLGELADHLVEELSGGQQQRVAVARAMALRPEVLLADEPTAEQDPTSRALVLDRLFDVTEHGGILLLATHDPEAAARCDQTVDVRPVSDASGRHRGAD